MQKKPRKQKYMEHISANYTRDNEGTQVGDRTKACCRIQNTKGRWFAE